MMYLPDCMIDLETLGTTPQTPVISIGAVFFDPKAKKLGGTFHMVLDVNEQIDRGRKPTGDTIKWWLGQTDAAKRIFHEKAQSVQIVLQTFSKWYVENNPKKAFVWGNGSTFDISILEDMLRDYKLGIPWGYNKVQDLRTFKRFVANGAQIVVEGTAHNALDDAIAQAKYVMEHTK